jgi:hypothetical protein
MSLRKSANALIYSFPIQLLFNNLKRNQIIMVCWIILFAMVTGNFGKYLGIPYLFLYPEYLNDVNFRSFFIMGLLTSGFTMAFHITCYISDGHRATFIGALSKPFEKFCFNNSIIPLAFLATYIYQIVLFQINNEFSSHAQLFFNLSGFISGYLVMGFLFVIYLRFTQKDIFVYMACRLDEKIKQSVRVTRGSAMTKLDIARKKQMRVDYYLDENLRFTKVGDEKEFYDRNAIVKVFDQNHFNLIIIELFIFAFILLLGIFKDSPAFQLPAAASFMIFLTVFVMMSGAFSYWFGGWSVTVGLAIFLVLNFLVGENFFSKPYPAFGLNYTVKRADYTQENIHRLNDSARINEDKQLTLNALANWRAKFPTNKKPKMVFICVSGGGKRAALWTVTALQTADSLSEGELMNHTMLITGASGGLVGASYFREIKLRQVKGEDIKPYSNKHRYNIATDNLNPLIFSLLANDLFVGFTKFEYGGQRYVRDRGFTFEEELNIDTDSLMDKPITGYKDDELSGKTPMLVLAPTIVNDGRKLYISALPVSYLNSDILNFPTYNNVKVGGVDFHGLFLEQGSDSLRFLSALRMSATFPYISPSTTLPTEPAIEIMDAGISDNFGVSDAVKFLYAFNDWIATNTSGVVIVSIRDSQKLSSIGASTGSSIIDNFTQPIASVYNNFENFQDIHNDNLIGFARSWFNGPIDRIDLQYLPGSYVPILQNMDSIRQHSARASLSWRLTTREKQSVMETINHPKNRDELKKLFELLK